MRPLSRSQFARRPQRAASSFRIATTWLLLSLIAGCSVLPEREPVQLLDPRLPEPETAREAPEWSLAVARPETDPARDSTRILVRTPDGRLQVHPEARWVAQAPELLRTLTVRHLRDAGTLGRVETAASRSERVLLSDLRRFELEEAADGSLVAVLVYEARLYDADGGGLVARRLVEHRARAAASSAADVLEAFETVLSDSLSELARWLSDQPAPHAVEGVSD